MDEGAGSHFRLIFKRVGIQKRLENQAGNFQPVALVARWMAEKLNRAG
jgi:hypothetical protein